ncbi:cysteine hydrolase [Aquabacter sp. L1I39]|uniref:cysteine hydrolase family protein n=1 Tax=Aquabacter sp. L1I39 TaxID=2820278 RepID=UPI001ADB358A|nr:cysteine hydrolase [Aquabacter sp. L1I39]QTL02119.1 cysteine hydrolase [Aquabacter sp. L1I39]
MGQGLTNGPLGRRAAHLCIDMQRLFAPGGPWPTPWAPRILPAVLALVERAPARTVFSRFMPPETPQDMPGAWQRFYERWRHLTGEVLPPEMLDLVPELKAFAPPARAVEKSRYSAFSGPRCFPVLRRLEVDTLILSGAETDVCVLATVFDAVDLGFRTIIARDAVCSSSDTGHDAVLALLRARLPQQVELADTDEILAAWSPLAEP